jgi:hypothetical protein
MRVGICFAYKTYILILMQYKSLILIINKFLLISGIIFLFHIL